MTAKISSLYLVLLTSTLVCQGAVIYLMGYSVDFNNNNLVLRPVHSLPSTVPTCQESVSLARLFYGGYAYLGKYGRIYRYLHFNSNNNTIEIRVCDCNPDCCGTDIQYSPFDVSRDSPTFQYNSSNSLHEYFYYTEKGESSTIYAAIRGRPDPVVIAKGADSGVSEFQALWCPLSGNCTFLGKSTSGDLVLGHFGVNGITDTCTGLPNEMEDAKYFKVEYSSGWGYQWIRSDNSIWGALGTTQTQCNLRAQLLVDSQWIKNPIDIDARSIGLNSWQIMFTDDEGAKYAQNPGQVPILIYANGPGKPSLFYFSGTLISVCQE